MSAVLAQFVAATRELLRSRLYAGLLAAGGLLVGAALSLAELSLGETVVALTDIGLAFVALVAAALALGVTTVGVASALSSREAIVVLSRPVARSSFVLGRFLASVLLVMVANTLLGLLLGLLVFTVGGKPLPVVAAALFSSFEAIIVAGLALVFAVRSGPVLAASVSVVLFVVGRMDQGLDRILEKGTLGPATPVMEALSHVLPRLSRFDLTGWVHGEAPPEEPLYAILYGLLYAGGLVLLATARFERRDIL